MVQIQYGRNRYQVEIVRSSRDIGIGMTKYGIPPSHGMIFILNGKYDTITMDGMKYPLDVIFLDSQWKQIGSMKRMYPNEKSIIPDYSMYMIEFPVGIVR